MKKFLTIDYLKTGNASQQLAYKELVGLGIMEKLKTYNPLLAGTIPIAIDIPSSDLDVLCYCTNHRTFSEKLIDLYAKKEGFKLETKQIKGLKTTLATFKGAHFPVEIFGQSVPSAQQDAYRHMLVEYQILQEKGSVFANKIIKLKIAGIKTEPAFAQLLELEGNPYLALLKLKI